MYERDVVASILRYLRGLPRCYAWKTHGNQYMAGIPDIIACVGGQFVAFEVKRPDGKPTPLQEATIRKINEAGGTARVVHSAEEVREILKNLNV